MRKTLRNAIYAGAFVAAANLLPSCEKGDTTPPKITISSPLDGKVYYNNRIVPVQIEIQDEGDFKEGWLSMNNGEKFPIYSKSFSINWYCKMGNNKLVVQAEDLNSNSSKDSVSFYIWPVLIRTEDIICK